MQDIYVAGLIFDCPRRVYKTLEVKKKKGKISTLLIHQEGRARLNGDLKSENLQCIHFVITVFRMFILHVEHCKRVMHLSTSSLS